VPLSEGWIFAMRIIFIHGPPAAGKLTIARELAARTGLALFHNHLTVDLLLALFPFGSPQFVALREQIWLDVMSAAVPAGRDFIFTFNPEATVQPSFVPGFVHRVRELGGHVEFVAIICPEEVIEARLDAPSRSTMRKLTSLDLYRELRAQHAFDHPPLPEPAVTVDSSLVSPAEAATLIMQRLEIASIP
jgi:hypothetical protein